jgi:hypothetical protein
MSFRNISIYRFKIHIYKLKGPDDHLCNQLLEPIGLQIIHLKKIKTLFIWWSWYFPKIKKFINGGTILPFLFNKIPKWMIHSFYTKNNHKKSFDNTNFSFSIIFHDQDNWLIPVKPFHRSSLISLFIKQIDFDS